LRSFPGRNAGLMTDILATNVTGKTLTTYDDLSPLLTGGELYKVRRHRTLGDVFGEDNESGLAGGSSVSEADEVLVLNPVSWARAGAIFIWERADRRR